MAVQGQAPDPSERIFIELKSKNDETKNKAATELRDLITLLSRGKLYIYPEETVLTIHRMGPGKVQRILRPCHQPN